MENIKHKRLNEILLEIYCTSEIDPRDVRLIVDEVIKTRDMVIDIASRLEEGTISLSADLTEQLLIELGRSTIDIPIGRLDVFEHNLTLGPRI